MSNSHPQESDIDSDKDFFQWEERDESTTYLSHCIAGSFAGVTEHVSLLPFDSIKTHMQVCDGKCSSWETAKFLYKTEGFTKFWKGASILMSGCIPAHSAYFSVYEYSKMKLLHKVGGDKNKIHPYLYALTGALATITHDFIITPFDMLKQRAQIAPRKFSQMKVLIAYIIKTEGVLSLYRGYPATVIMNMPQASVIVSVNETLKVSFKPDNGHNFFTYFACAAIAGATAALVTLPLDNIRTRLQIQAFYHESRSDSSVLEKKVKEKKLYKVATASMTNLKEAIEKKNIKYNSISSTAKIIFKEDGLKGFYRGAIPRIIAQAPSSAISWSTYEMLKRLLNKKSEL